MRYLIVIIALFLVSCDCSKREADGYTATDISKTYKNAYDKGREHILDSISENDEITPVDVKVKTKKILKYYGADFDLPPGLVVNFTPEDADIKKDADSEISIHIKDLNGVIKVYRTTHHAWLNIYEGAELI